MSKATAFFAVLIALVCVHELAMNINYTYAATTRSNKLQRQGSVSGNGGGSPLPRQGSVRGNGGGSSLPRQGSVGGGKGSGSNNGNKNAGSSSNDKVKAGVENVLKEASCFFKEVLGIDTQKKGPTDLSSGCTTAKTYLSNLLFCGLFGSECGSKVSNMSRMSKMIDNIVPGIAQKELKQHIVENYNYDNAHFCTLTQYMCDLSEKDETLKDAAESLADLIPLGGLIRYACKRLRNNTETSGPAAPDKNVAIASAIMCRTFAKSCNGHGVVGNLVHHIIPHFSLINELQPVHSLLCPAVDQACCMTSNYCFMNLLP